MAMACSASPQSGELRPLDRPVPQETPLSIFLEAREWVTVLCTPAQLQPFLLGFLYFAEAIDSPDDVLLLRVCDDETTAEVRLREPERAVSALGRRRMLTSGCAGGTVFDAIRETPPITNEAPVDPATIAAAIASRWSAVHGRPAFLPTSCIHSSMSCLRRSAAAASASTDFASYSCTRQPRASAAASSASRNITPSARVCAW